MNERAIPKQTLYFYMDAWHAKTNDCIWLSCECDFNFDAPGISSVLPLSKAGEHTLTSPDLVCHSTLTS